jgi:hypothetical protein
MVQGFIVEYHTGGKSLVKCVPVGTFRCSACGFLESYACPEFAPK